MSKPRQRYRGAQRSRPNLDAVSRGGLTPVAPAYFALPQCRSHLPALPQRSPHCPDVRVSRPGVQMVPIRRLQQAGHSGAWLHPGDVGVDAEGHARVPVAPLCGGDGRVLAKLGAQCRIGSAQRGKVMPSGKSGWPSEANCSLARSIARSEKIETRSRRPSRQPRAAGRRTPGSASYNTGRIQAFDHSPLDCVPDDYVVFLLSVSHLSVPTAGRRAGECLGAGAHRSGGAN